ncbi:hypothetical protein HX109_05095 [Galbibacter sp. BG1]|uniref:hypothetical protein n=1 Tax=Galbibacter sp. BG1 TaxID=1170699 RepID=UPI0015C013AE|nr:hypothetical protein [Galbibacter sp. BG1]QLE00972.1 hypothetical protein HX109_05095 [Galbibacter sp. BG1]
MKNIQYHITSILLCLLGYNTMFAQQEKQLKVLIFQEDVIFKNYSIINFANSKEGWMQGNYYLINVMVGDELLVSSNEFDNFYMMVTSEEFNKGVVEVNIDKEVIQLEEVVLTGQKLSYGTFTDYVPKVHTPAERRLKAATKMYYPGSGLSLSLDPILNAISGRTKKLKKRLKGETTSFDVSFLENNYKEFILKELNVPPNEIGTFAYFVADHNEKIYTIEDSKKVELILRQSYLQYLSQTLEED